MRVCATLAVKNLKVRRSLAVILGVAMLLRSYYVRELLIGEMFFALASVVVLGAGGAAYLAGSVAASWFEHAGPK